MLPCVCAICPSVFECEVESMHIPASSCVCVREKKIEWVPALRVCANGCELLLLYVHVCLCVGLESSARPHWPLSGRRCVSELILCFCSLVLPRISLHTVISPRYSTRLLSGRRRAQIKCSALCLVNTKRDKGRVLYYPTLQISSALQNFILFFSSLFWFSIPQPVSV